MPKRHSRHGLVQALRIGPSLVLALGFAASSGHAQSQATAPAATAKGKAGVRNARYCEVIPVVRDGIHLVATVYNTLGLNDCPAATWGSLTEEPLKQRFGAVKVMLNGPRYFLMDTIVGEGATAAGETIDVGGLAMTQRATINLSLTELGQKPYHEHVINRQTRYVFDAGKPVFVLVAPDGSRYAMQAYAQIVDKTLSYDDLPKLGERLKLPKGWRYTVLMPDKDLTVGAQGKAVVVQDDLDDTYQKLN
ncbi:MAG TPA: hypothetical protein VG651_23885 [Stellaceae bacterium]|nr:hypothetical protein [Stellaceae bacterium]